MKNQLFLSLTLFAILVTSCQKPEDILPESPMQARVLPGSLQEYLIAPSTTNPSIFLYNNNHYVCVDTRVTAKNKLFIFFPGTGGSPEFYKLIVKHAASLGYYAIGLMYPNGSEMYTWSGANPDNSQFGKCRKEIFDGTNQTLGVAVNSTNCIKGRLYRLLQYLAVTYPTLNFQQFINGTNVYWSKCTLAGHSQGGGHAFYIGKQVAVERSIAFGSIDWNTYYNRSADWVSVAGATPVSKFYSINSTRDEVFNYTNVQTQLTVMGLAGTPVSIDNVTPPYGNSHRLTTSATPAISVIVPNHNIACLDGYVPKTSTGAVSTSFANAWTYLISY